MSTVDTQSPSIRKSKVAYDFLGKSKMANLIIKYDWSKTSLGPISTWSISVRTAVGMMLQSPVPIILLWGNDGYTIYNDAYSGFAGGRHPRLLGQTVVEAWPEVADFNRNVMVQCLNGKTLSYKDQPLTLYRHNQPEEVSMDLNYSPILGDDSTPVAVMAIVVETTSRVNAEEKQIHAEADLRAERERLHSLFMEAPAIIAVLRGPRHIYEMANPLYLQLVGNRQILGKSIHEALPELAGQGIYELLDDVYKTGKSYIGNEIAVNVKQGNGRLEEVYVNFIYQASHDANGKIDGILIHAIDVTDQVKARKHTEDQNKVLEMITSGASLPDALEFLILTIEKQASFGMRATVLLLSDDQQHLIHGAAPSLPQSYNKAIDGIAIGPNVGSCGSAAFTKKPVIVSDTMHDEHWKDFRDLARRYHLAACWSSPILSSKQEVIGTFAMYYPETRTPSEGDKQVIQFATRTAALIIERKKVEEELWETERRFRFVVQNATDIITVFDKSGIVKYQSPSITRVLGHKPRNRQDANIFDSALVHPDDKKAKQAFLRKLVNAKPDTQLQGEFRMIHADGSWHDIEAIGINLIHIPQLNGIILSSRDITDRKRSDEAFRESEIQKEALMRINRTKDEFIAMASHQLRTPATAVKQYIGILLNGIVEPLTPVQQSYLQTAYDSNERELRIINELLKTAQIDSDKYQLDPEVHNIASLITSCIEELKPTFQTRQQTIVLQVPADELSIQVDPTEMSLVFSNLLENASKYSEIGTKITVTVKTKGQFAELSISDKGVGIDKADQTRIFDRFTRIDNELSDTVNGSGLGLYWVKQIVELHKGSIKLSSTPGKGSKFTVRLPLSKTNIA
jgi:PAS domain S-box-containing protein